MTQGRSATIAIAAVALVAPMLCALGCSDPYVEVRAGLSPEDVERFDRGARVATPCATCHDLSGKAVKLGPHLDALIGRRAGGLQGFAYSRAMAESSITWSPRSLDAFLAAPQSVVPGNRMMSPGVTDSTARADLVFFLIQASADGRSSDAP